MYDCNFSELPRGIFVHINVHSEHVCMLFNYVVYFMCLSISVEWCLKIWRWLNISIMRCPDLTTLYV